MLSGLLIGIAAPWAYHFFNRLWQQSLREEAREAIDVASQLGLTSVGPVYGPRVVFSGTINTTPVQIEWRGGLLGARTVLRQGEQPKVRLPFITTADALRDALPEAAAAAEP